MTTTRDAQTDENTVITMDMETIKGYLIDPGNAEIFIVAGLSRTSTFGVVFSLCLVFALTVAMLALTLQT